MQKCMMLGGISKNTFHTLRLSMSNPKVEKVSSEDSLQIIENDDGTFTLEWDPNDPRWSMFNDIPEEELSAMITNGLKDYLEATEDE